MLCQVFRGYSVPVFWIVFCPKRFAVCAFEAIGATFGKYFVTIFIHRHLSSKGMVNATNILGLQS